MGSSLLHFSSPLSSSPPPPRVVVVVVFFSVLISSPNSVFALNITSVLSSYPDLSEFTRLLSSTSIPSDLTNRSSLTLLAVPNRFLRHLPPPTSIPDSLRLHVLLQYLSWPDLRGLPHSGALFTTLLQTTGRALNSDGAVNLTLSASGAAVAVSSAAASNTTVLSLVDSFPYNLSIFAVDALLLPPTLAVSAAESGPLLGLNITRALTGARCFNVFAALLSASGVAVELEADERGAGITLFAPDDGAFAGAALRGRRLQSLPAEQKAAVLRYHVLHSYYPLGNLESIVNPVQPTLATEDSGAGRLTLNITRDANGSVAIDTGLVQASITQTVFDQNPVSIFAVSRVLLPVEIFGKERLPPQLGATPPLSPVPTAKVSPTNQMGVTPPPSPSPPPPPPPPPQPLIGGEIRSSSGIGMDRTEKRSDSAKHAFVYLCMIFLLVG